MWHFKDLDEDQKHERRRLLDRYGSIAQFSVVLPLLVLQFYFLATYLRRWKGGSDQIPSSPQLKRQRRGKVTRVGSRLRGVWRRTIWASGDEIRVLGWSGTKGEVVASVVWTTWLLTLSGLQTQGDYLHLTKRLGIVGASQLPLQYLLALKSPWSPLYHLTGLTWEHLNNLHQMLGRTTTLLFYLHTSLYLNFFIQAQVLTKRLKSRDVILGLLGILCFTVISTTALHWLRKLNYRIFYTIHVTLSTLLLPVLYFHVHHIRIYILETLSIFALHTLLRYLASKQVSATITLLPGTTDILTITIPPSQREPSWHPGQHIYISTCTSGSPITTKNPFTIASLPRDGNLLLIAKLHNGNTKSLLTAASGTHTIPLSIEGPYGLTTHPVSLLSHTRTLFIAGGVGATFVVPLYRTLLQDLSPSPGSHRRRNVEFIWAVRGLRETGWAVPSTEMEERGMRERMTVFVTRDKHVACTTHTQDTKDALENETEENDAPENETEEGVEMEALLPSAGEKTEDVGWDVEYKRPDVGKFIDETLRHTSEDESVAIVVCGPKTLADEVRRKTGRWVGKRDVWLHVEAFNL